LTETAQTQFHQYFKGNEKTAKVLFGYQRMGRSIMRRESAGGDAAGVQILEA
jgi:hypothetical protein